MTDLLAKKCTKCGEWKPRTRDHFRTHSSISDGLRPECRICSGVAAKERDERLRERRMAARPALKRCLTCCETKSCAEFSHWKNSPDSLAPYCKTCRADAERKRRRADPGYIAIKDRERHRRRKFTHAEISRQKRKGKIYRLKASIAISLCRELGVDIDKLAKEKYDADFPSNV